MIGPHSAIDKLARLLPAAAWVVDPLWREAKWSGTAYQFDKAGESPPIMALVFENDEKGRELFRTWTSQYGNRDELEEIGITVIEGNVAGAPPGYFIQISPDPENSMIRAAAEGLVLDEVPCLGQVQHMEPVDGVGMITRFRERFEKHGEFLFAPTTLRNGDRWVNLDCGIIKTAIHFCKVDEVISERTRGVDSSFNWPRAPE